MIIAIFITLMWLSMTLYSFKKLKHKHMTKELIVSLSGSFIMDQLKLEQRAATIIQHLHANLLLLEQVGWTYHMTRHRLIAKLGEGMLVMVGGSWLAVLAQDNMLFAVTVSCVLAILFHFYYGTIQRIKLRRQAIIVELPIVLTKMTLLIEAGETISQAFIKCMADHQGSKHPLHCEWNLAINKLQNGESFPLTIEAFTKRCSVQPISVLSTYMLLNYARGGGHFVTSIQELMKELWEQRKTIARKKGEEASSKLIFPTIFILLLLMVLIVTPAIRLIDFI